MEIVDIDFFREGRRMINEMAQTLLDAGARPNGPKNCAPLDQLLHYRLMTRPFQSLRRSVEQSIDGYHFLLMVDLVKLLVKYDAKLKRLECCFEPYSSCILMAEDIALPVLLNICSYLDVCNSIMDSIADLYRCLLLADAGITQPSLQIEPLTCKCGGTDDTDEDDELKEWNDSFTCSFIHLADYSSQPGASTKMIELLLDTMSQDEMLLMRTKFFKFVKSPAAIDSYDLRSLTHALEWICSVQMPFSLEKLARRKILGTLKYRKDVNTLSLPKHMKEYVLFNW